MSDCSNFIILVDAYLHTSLCINVSEVYGINAQWIYAEVFIAPYMRQFENNISLIYQATQL